MLIFPGLIIFVVQAQPPTLRCPACCARLACRTPALFPAVCTAFAAAVWRNTPLDSSPSPAQLPAVTRYKSIPLPVLYICTGIQWTGTGTAIVRADPRCYLYLFRYRYSSIFQHPKGLPVSRLLVCFKTFFLPFL